MSVFKRVVNHLSKIKIPVKSAIVFDIDDTLIKSRNGKGIVDVLRSYYLVKLSGIKPIIITERLYTWDVIGQTNKDLERFQINDPIIFFRPEGMEDYERYKLLTRKFITEKNYDIVMSIGDQPYDIGEYGGHGIIVKRRN
jgi:predicted secreted acid phosphatase